MFLKIERGRVPPQMPLNQEGITSFPSIICWRIQSVLSGETDEIARMSNMAALLHFEFGFSLKDFFKRRIIR